MTKENWERELFYLLTAALMGDSLGRCLGATDPSSGSDNLGLQQLNDFSYFTPSQVFTHWVISDTNAAGAAPSSSSILQGNNTTLTETISPLNIINWQAEADNGDIAMTNADGSVLLATFVGDPRFPGQTHLLSLATLAVPGGLTWQETASYAIATNSQTTLGAGGWTNLFSLNGNIYTDAYNGSNLSLVTITPEGRQDTLRLDTQGRPIAESQPGLATTTVSYDSAGRLGSISDQSAEGNRTSTLAYDSLGRLSLITDPLGRTNGFAYDAANRLRQPTLTDGRVANYQYDAEYNLTAITPPGRPAHTFNYNAVGQLTNYAPPFVSEDDSIHYAYDTQRHLTQAQFPDGQAMLLNWNADGNLTNLVLGSEPTLSFAYSTGSGQLTNISTSTGDAMGFTHQGALLSVVQWSGSVTGSVNVQFNNDLRVASQSVNDASGIAYGYDGDGLLTNGGPMRLARDTNGFVTATSLGLVQDVRQNDDLGRMTDYSVTVVGSDFWSVALSFDPLDRITNKGGRSTRCRVGDFRLVLG
jgi:YD repeat-containing protein